MSHDNTMPIWVGMDVHQNSITVAIYEHDSQDPEVLRLPGEVTAVRKLFRQLSRRGAPRGCYEASGAGFVLQRALDKSGFVCDVIAPSLIPRRPGDRRKNDRLDAIWLARHYRSGNLTKVAVPDLDTEAVRRLVRSRLATQQEITRLKHRIVRVLMVHGYRFTGTKSNWTAKHRVWLRDLQKKLVGPLQAVLTFDLELLEYLEAQRNNFDRMIDEIAQQEPWRSGVQGLCCFRGVKTLTAMTLLTEIGDIRRFRSPRGLMAYTGLVPGERASGEKHHRGPITKSGNPHLRRVLGEAAWHNRHKVGADQKLRNRRHGQDPRVVAIAIKAQHRLYKRYWRLQERKGTYKAVIAVARELAGFIWAAMWAIAEREVAH